MKIPGILFWIAVFAALADPRVGLVLLIASLAMAVLQRIRIHTNIDASDHKGMELPRQDGHPS